MKITNAEVIKIGEKDLIDSITADLDWGAIESIFLTEHNLGIDEDIEYKKGDIISYNNQVAYKLEFAVKVNLSVLINRDGEYLSVKILGKDDTCEGEINDKVTYDKKGDYSNENDMVVQSKGMPEGEGVSSGNNAEGEKAKDDKNKREDKYLDALEQLDSNDSSEEYGGAIN